MELAWVCFHFFFCSLGLYVFLDTTSGAFYSCMAQKPEDVQYKWNLDLRLISDVALHYKYCMEVLQSVSANGSPGNLKFTFEGSESESPCKSVKMRRILLESRRKLRLWYSNRVL